jgi:hypothetical protein
MSVSYDGDLPFRYRKNQWTDILSIIFTNNLLVKFSKNE